MKYLLVVLLIIVSSDTQSFAMGIRKPKELKELIAENNKQKVIKQAEISTLKEIKEKLNQERLTLNKALSEGKYLNDAAKGATDMMKHGVGGDGRGYEASAFGGDGGGAGGGGAGGAGGNGGAGGAINIFFVSDQSAAGPPILNNNGGIEGKGGLGGKPGNEGAAGAAGPFSDFSHSNYQPGNPPNIGAVGSPGKPGLPGSPGQSGPPVNIQRVTTVN